MVFFYKHPKPQSNHKQPAQHDQYSLNCQACEKQRKTEKLSQIRGDKRDTTKLILSPEQGPEQEKDISAKTDEIQIRPEVSFLVLANVSK